MGYNPKKLFLHSLKDNKRYEIDLPGEFGKQFLKNLVKKIKELKPEDLLKNNCDYYSQISIYGGLSW